MRSALPTVTQNTVHQHVVDKERRRCVVWRGGWGMVLAPPESRDYQEPPSVLCRVGGANCSAFRATTSPETHSPCQNLPKTEDISPPIHRYKSI